MAVVQTRTAKKASEAGITFILRVRTARLLLTFVFTLSVLKTKLDICPQDRS